MKNWLLYFFCFPVLTLSAQPSLGLYGNVGLNRIGVLYDIGAFYELNRHHMGLGVRFYEPDLVFEKETPGVHIIYHYNWPPFRRFNFFSGAQLSYFYENKMESQLHLVDPKVCIGGAWSLNEKLDLKTDFAIGTTQNVVKGLSTVESEHFTYLNYEIKLGIFYRFGRIHQ